jgi:hypothetical protein
MAQMSTIADFFRQQEGYFSSLAAFVLVFIALVGIYLLSFLVIRFIIFLCRKLRKGGRSDGSAMTLAALLSTFLWPAFLSIGYTIWMIWTILSRDRAIESADWVEIAQIFFGVLLVAMVYIAPISSTLGGALLVLYLVRQKEVQRRLIFILVSSIMFLQCVYLEFVLFVLGSN